MEQNLDTLVNRIYEDGLQKARKEAQEITSRANSEAEEILSNAQKEAESILQKARSEADYLKQSTESELKLASTQALSRLRSQIIAILSERVLSDSVKEAALDSQFIQEMVLALGKNWKEDGAVSIELTLPESMRKSADEKFQAAIQKELDGLSIQFSDIGAGFQVQKKGSSFQLDFTDESLKALLKPYLRKITVDRFLSDAGN
jgi:V/A-type H+-transporting ATPase subunit E